MSKRPFICLGIETSCDETSAALVRDGHKVLSHIVISQENLHKEYAGVVPEIACRAHLESILFVIDRAIKKAKLNRSEIDTIAVTITPGLIGALLVGLSVAKTLALVWHKPLIGINHLEAHLYAVYLENPRPRFQFPVIGLVASGGHTSLFISRRPFVYQKIGGTVDDAAGEAFDKVAAILGLSYPGGPSIEKSARTGNPNVIKFPRGFTDAAGRRGSLDFSFSGLKTAVLYYARGQNARRDTPLKKGIRIADVSAGFQEAVVDTLVERIFQAVRKYRAKTVIMGGGVVANNRLRDKILRRAETENVRFIMPPVRFCTDNAAMVAGLAFQKWKTGKISNLYLDAIPTP